MSPLSENHSDYTHFVLEFDRTCRQISRPIALGDSLPSKLLSRCTTQLPFLLTNAVSSCGLEISFSGAVVPCLEGPCLFATGVLSLSSSKDFEGVTGTFKGCAECLDIWH